MRKILSFRASALFSISLLVLASQTIAANSHNEQIPRVAFPDKKIADIDALKWRFIGPMTGNRGSAVENGLAT
jgi:hypothetical protein